MSAKCQQLKSYTSVVLFVREHRDFLVCSESNQSVGEIAEYAVGHLEEIRSLKALFWFRKKAFEFELLFHCSLKTLFANFLLLNG